MAARKLQTEIDRTLKKVSEGVELFESIYDKMQASTNQTQKEKLETDLKTQIKKLQRLRDQIKTWVASNDIKDKSALLDNRRLIETQMEKFKACEKEMKTKAFSKEGLIQSAKLDPKAQEKLEITHWLQSQVEELQMQVEQAEAEIETLQGGGKRKNRAGGAQAERLENLERLNERRKWHISRLELILRLLENGSISVERINALKDDVAYFVESNTEEEFDEDEGIYDELNLDEEEEKFGLAVDDNDTDESEDASEDLPPRTPSKKLYDEESVASSKRDGSPVLKKSTGMTLQLRTSKPSPSPISILKPNPPPQPQPRSAAPLPIKYAAAAAAAVNPPTPSQAATSQTPATPSATTTSTSTPSAVPTPPSIPSTTTTEQTAAMSSPSLTHPSLTSPLLSSAASASVAQADGSLYSAHASPALSEAPPAGGQPTVSPRAAIRHLATESPSVSHPPPTSSVFPETQPSAPQQAANGLSQASQVSTLQGGSPTTQETSTQAAARSALSGPQAPGTSPMPQPQQALLQFPPGVKVPASEQVHPTVIGQQPQPQGARPPSAAPSQGLSQQQQRPTAPTAFPGSLSDLVMSFENVKQKAPHRMSNLGEVHKLLEGSYTTMPQPQDTEKPKYYVPRNPFQTPSYYPQTPHPVLNTPGIFSQLDVETLFYVFYFHPGTYQQYLAAKELKRQSWRFHVKYLTWFQRHSEPQAITEEYEQGVYVYFDWEGSWCQRKKSDFRFEYRYLSED
ncbi:unnamed protein product [Somion occarium]|uniref:General negative regulator of transcription subunit n=1 Tax=Somion occarium TaxID=3059160 RepID=A0ABP1D2P4_9APHY